MKEREAGQGRYTVEMSVIGVDRVRELAKGLGFALVGVAPAQASAFGEYVRRWLESDKHGEMAYLANNLEARLDPQKLLPGAVSVICVADQYPSQGGVSGSTGVDRRVARGRIARYAWGDDYHRVIKKRLFALADALRERYPGYEYKSAVDTAPVMEREHAQRAGLGWVGKHTLLIHPRLGSWLLLGEIVTTLPIRLEDGLSGTSRSAGVGPEASHCGTCTRCIDACPTGCISEYELDAKRCISYLTLEHRGPIDADLHGQMGDWVAGCDICQEVCPFNQRESDIQASGADRHHNEADAPPDGDKHEIIQNESGAGRPGVPGAGVPGGCHPRYTLRPPGPAVGLLEVLGWDEQARQEAFRNSALKRVKLGMLKRNALIAVGNELKNLWDEALYSRVRQLARDERQPELVRQTASQVLEKLKPGQSG